MSVPERAIGASLAQRPFAERLPRRRRKTAWVAAVLFPLLLTLGQRALGSSVPPATTLFVILLVVVVVALLGGVRPALAATLTGLIAQEVLFEFPYGSLNNHEPAQVSVLVVFVVIGAGIGILVDELARLHTEQAALRRLAALVARGVRPAELFSAVADEVASLLDVDSALVARLDPDGVLTILAAGAVYADEFDVGERLKVEPPLAVAEVWRTGRPARADGYHQASPELRGRIARLGVRSSVATPITVNGHLWGVVVASSWRGPLPAETEQRMLDFTELVATAIASAESRAELTASRARIVAAADESRRRIERDLHDGAQQRLVSLALELRATQAALPPGLDQIQGELSHVAEGLAHAQRELQEMSRGIHPVILSNSGVGPAVKALARRSSVPVDLDLGVPQRLPEQIEVAAYYVVSEMLTNAAKHANASSVHVGIETAGPILRVSVSDDGIGGADPSSGSGLVGLRDRVEALGGTISIQSPPGAGTRLTVELPVEAHG
jgi:signal transduction histidine kinase